MYKQPIKITADSPDGTLYDKRNCGYVNITMKNNGYKFAYYYINSQKKLKHILWH